MADRSEYTVTIGGVAHTMRLSSDDAKRYGDAVEPVKAKAAAAPKNKARSASNEKG